MCSPDADDVVFRNAVVQECVHDVLDNIIQPRAQATTRDNRCCNIGRVVVNRTPWACPDCPWRQGFEISRICVKKPRRAGAFELESLQRHQILRADESESGYRTLCRDGQDQDQDRSLSILRTASFTHDSCCSKSFQLIPLAP